MSRDWSKYNKQLVKRGEILISPTNFGLKPKNKPARKTGRPPLYPDQLILMLLFIKFALRLPYRQTQGLAKKLFESIGTKVPDFRTLHYRFKTMDIDIKDFPDPEDLPEDFVIVLDSTGIKVTNRGEWLRKKHGKRARKGWIKLHVAFDLKRKKVVNIEVTDERTHDSQKSEELVEGAKREVLCPKKVLDFFLTQVSSSFYTSFHAYPYTTPATINMFIIPTLNTSSFLIFSNPLLTTYSPNHRLKTEKKLSTSHLLPYSTSLFHRLFPFLLIALITLSLNGFPLIFASLNFLSTC